MKLHYFILALCSAFSLSLGENPVTIEITDAEFRTKFINYLDDYNISKEVKILPDKNGILQNKDFDHKLKAKYDKFADLLDEVNKAFGFTGIFTRIVDIKQNEISKVEISVSLNNMDQDLAKNIDPNNQLRDKQKEFQLIFKLCLPPNSHAYVDFHCPLDDCEPSYKKYKDVVACKK